MYVFLFIFSKELYIILKTKTLHLFNIESFWSNMSFYTTDKSSIKDRFSVKIQILMVALAIRIWRLFDIR